jgi:hypothetical protein
LLHSGLWIEYIVIFTFKVAKKYSKIAYDIFLDLEKIIDDTTLNMSIKTIAISIFLKISEELSNSRLEKLFQTICEQYSVFKEEFKKEIISISRNICKDHPNKQSVSIILSRFISVSSINA